MTEDRIIDAVVIGRNEGDRLVECLNSLQGQVREIVYVDSGSSDDSVSVARAAGAEVVELDMTHPFTAARARNAGFARLDGHADFVQFVDGDCALFDGWIDAARSFLENEPKVAVVCGRRRERHPDTSVYNRLCDAEWNTPVGLTKACGGDAMIRANALQEVGGYREDLIAGEEPELCVRLRQDGWQIWRLDHDMTWHDAAMTGFRQWWTRTRRAGFAYAQGAALHGAPPERHWVKERRRAAAWGIGLPLVTLIGSAFTSLAWIMLLAYPAQILRLAARSGFSRFGWENAFFTTIGKFAEAHGVIQFYWGRITKRHRGLIEYK